PRPTTHRRSSSSASTSRRAGRRNVADEAQETFLSHLIELRERLVRSLLAVGLLFLPAFYFSAELYDFLALPLVGALPQGSRMIATGVITPFLIPMKIAAMAAFLVALPYVLYEV